MAAQGLALKAELHTAGANHRSATDLVLALLENQGSHGFVHRSWTSAWRD